MSSLWYATPLEAARKGEENLRKYVGGRVWVCRCHKPPIPERPYILVNPGYENTGDLEAIQEVVVLPKRTSK